MIKKILFIFCFIILLFFSNLNAQVVDSTKKLVDTTINPETGQVKKIEDLQKNFEGFKNIEQNKSYFNQEMSIILGKTPVIGPLLFYTKQIFSLLNPVWIFLFKMPFSWSWNFILIFLLFIILLKLIYDIIDSISKFNIFVRMILSFIIVSLVCLSGILNRLANELKFAIVNFWIGTIIFIIGIIIIILIDYIMKSLGKNLKDSASEEEKRRRENIERISTENRENELRRNLKNPR
ncbi:MAG: hypothetical protein WC867_00970 [Candidatus Pacearchaeota archaeon]|jgi:hypothetical protein